MKLEQYSFIVTLDILLKKRLLINSNTTNEHSWYLLDEQKGLEGEHWKTCQNTSQENLQENSK